MTTPRVEINFDICDKEGLCVQICIDGVFEQTDLDSFPVVAYPDRCWMCGQCIAVCPGDSITVQGIDLNNCLPISPEMKVEPDQLQEFMRSRRSVRNYHKKRPVRRETIEKVIEAARYAPTGSNAQSLQHIVVETRETIDILVKHTVEALRKKLHQWSEEAALANMEPWEVIRAQADRDFYERIITEYDAGIDNIFYTAPVVIITHADLAVTSCPLEDATIAAHQMMLMAESLGLGTCYIGNFYPYANDSPAIREILQIPEGNDIFMAFTLGYPAIRFTKLVDRNLLEVHWM
jgi:nitroreductase/NAD-dependent dihydropyrimidine dehydrogenase PreA subunit